MLSAENRRLIAANGIVVWLRARPGTLAGRVGDGVGRPLLGDDPSEAIVGLEAVRAPLYAEVADVIIDVDELPPSAVTDRIIDAMDAAADTNTCDRPGRSNVAGRRRARCVPFPSTWPSVRTPCSSAPGRVTKSPASSRPAPSRP